jgi:hypothetical protein
MFIFLDPITHPLGVYLKGALRDALETWMIAAVLFVIAEFWK